MSDLPAGRELDALIAEKVMGDERGEWRDGLGCARFHWRHRAYGDATPTLMEDPPPYSTDIAAAWDVVEHIRRTSLQGSFNVFVQGANVHANDGVMCDDFGCNDSCADASTAPLAICRAALRMVGTLR